MRATLTFAALALSLAGCSAIPPKPQAEATTAIEPHPAVQNAQRVARLMPGLLQTTETMEQSRIKIPQEICSSELALSGALTLRLAETAKLHNAAPSSPAHEQLKSELAKRVNQLDGVYHVMSRKCGEIYQLFNAPLGLDLSTAATSNQLSLVARYRNGTQQVKLQP